MSTLAQNVPGSPVQNTGGQSIWGNVTGFLNGALDTYARYEQIRAGQNPQLTYAEKTNVVSVPSGQAVVVEGAAGTQASAQQASFSIAGYSVPKPIAYGVLAIGGLLLLKKAKVL